MNGAATNGIASEHASTAASRLSRWIAAAAFAVAGAAFAESPFEDRLTGGWGGARQSLADRGITIDADWTNFYHGLVSGTGDKDFEYGGRGDAYLDFNTGKLGLWRGGLIRTHAEYRYGDLGSTLGGTIVPNVLGMRLPEENGNKLVFTNIALAQQLGERSSFILGKINTVDLIAGHPFFGGAGVTRFSNLAFAAPANGLLPPVIMGGIYSLNTQPLSWTFMVYDPNERTEDYLPDDLFEDGVNVSASGKYGFKLGGRTTSLTVTGIYSTKDSVDLGEVLLPADLRTGRKSDSWHASVQFDHFLREDPDKPGSGWGVFVKAGASDGNPNPYGAFITGGIGGNGLFRSRPQDGFGIGYFYYNFSDDLQSAIDPLAEFADESGVEVFYNFHVTRWFHLTADIQYVNPATGQNKNTLVGGVRLRVRF